MVLFLEKGYRSTSIDDICRTAHVNRGSIYYHFKDKENIRYEVLWCSIMESVGQVRASGKPVPAKYEYLLAVYLLWERICREETVRRFFVEYFQDYPVYSPKDNLARSVVTLLNQINRQILPDYETDRLGKTSVYGFIMSVVMLTQKTEFEPDNLFRQIFLISNLIRGVLREKIDGEWDAVQSLIQQFSA